jgi:hypothetical protein
MRYKSDPGRAVRSVEGGPPPRSWAYPQRSRAQTLLGDARMSYVVCRMSHAHVVRIVWGSYGGEIPKRYVVCRMDRMA